MNILIIGGGSWDDTTSLGNTMSNFFNGWEDVNFYNLYFRETAPNNYVCKNYFKITTKELLKKYFQSRLIGESIIYSEYPQNQEDLIGENEKKAISLIHRYNLKGIYELEDFLWYKGKWKNNRLDQYIDNVKPDIIFSFAAGNSYMVLPIEYILSRTNAKLVLFVADDMHTTYRLTDDMHSKRMRYELDKLIGLADKVYGVSEELCSYYKKLYDIDVTPLYKGCQFDTVVKKHINKPIRFVYAGNLLFGRDKTLLTFIDALEKINQCEIKVNLDIYSGTVITEELLHKLNRKNVSIFHGKKNYNEIKKRMSEADVVMHIESFDERQIQQVKYSFSTKIIDCLQSGSAMLAIGPKNISSIEYSRNIPGCTVIDNIEDIYNVINNLLTNESELRKKAGLSRDYAKKKHDINIVRSKLKKDFEMLLNENNIL